MASALDCLVVCIAYFGQLLQAIGYSGGIWDSKRLETFCVSLHNAENQLVAVFWYWLSDASYQFSDRDYLRFEI